MLNIIVFIRQVPSTESLIKLSEDSKSIKLDNIKWIINPYDEFAIEEAVRIKEKFGGLIYAVLAGDKAGEALLRTALAMGADKGLLIQDVLIQNCLELDLAKIFSFIAQKNQFNLIITGAKSIDNESSFLGAAIAATLDIPLISLITKQEIKDKKIICQKDGDLGFEIIEKALPVVITAQKGLNQPRFVSMPGIMKAKKKPLEIKNLADIGFEKSRLTCIKQDIKFANFEKERKKEIITGENLQEKVSKLAKILCQEAF